MVARSMPDQPSSPGRKCPDCAHLNPPDADYCEKCAHQLSALTGESPLADAESRAEVFGGKGAWLDKSVKEVPAGQRDAGPRPLNEVGAGEPELELAYDPVAKARLDEEAAEAARQADAAGMLKPSKPEFTLRAVLIGILVALFVGASYPYVVLKIGFGPNISVVSAFFGYMAISVIGFFATKLTGRDSSGSRTEYNLVQTAGTAAGQSGFMCVLLAAFDMLASKPALNFHVQPTPIQIFLWLSIGGCLGVLLAVPLRKHYIDDEKLTFADGVAAGETLLVLDAGQEQAKRRLRWLLYGGLFSAITTWFRDGAPKVIPENSYLDKTDKALNVGMNWSALSFGSGLLIGLRITLSMALGMFIAWILLPRYLYEQKWTSGLTFNETIRWVMWPATGLMVAGGLTALALKWKLIVKTFSEMKLSSASSSDFPILWVGIGSAILATALVVLQKFSLGIGVFESIIAIAVSIPLMLVGTRVLGETNWAPISAMANMVQALFAFISPGNMATNMVASGMSGVVASNGEHLMQDYKAGKIVGSNNRYLTYMQLIATPVGAAAVAIVYPLLKRTFGIGGERYGLDPTLGAKDASGLSSPISVKWSGFAELLSGGAGALATSAMYALIGGCIVGILITLFEKNWKNYLPSPTGIGLGMLIPAKYVIPMVLGGIVQAVWVRINEKNEKELSTPLASGLIVGEAMLALIISMLGIMGAMPYIVDFMAPVTNFINEQLGISVDITPH